MAELLLDQLSNAWTEHDEDQYGNYSRWMGELHLIIDRYDAPEVDVPGGWYAEVVAYSPNGGVTFESSVYHDFCYDRLQDAKAAAEKWAAGIIAAQSVSQSPKEDS